LKVQLSPYVKNIKEFNRRVFSCDTMTFVYFVAVYGLGDMDNS